MFDKKCKMVNCNYITEEINGLVMITVVYFATICKSGPRVRFTKAKTVLF